MRTVGPYTVFNARYVRNMNIFRVLDVIVSRNLQQLAFSRQIQWSAAWQVKIWFQNRRTKDRRERLGNAGNDVMSMTSSAESDEYVDVDSPAHVTSGWARDPFQFVLAAQASYYMFRIELHKGHSIIYVVLLYNNNYYYIVLGRSSTVTRWWVYARLLYHCERTQNKSKLYPHLHL